MSEQLVASRDKKMRSVYIKQGERLLLTDGIPNSETYEIQGLVIALRDIDLVEELRQFHALHTQVQRDIGVYDWYETKRQFLAHLLATRAMHATPYRELNLDDRETDTSV